MKKMAALLTGGLLGALSHPLLAHGGDHAVQFVGSVSHFFTDPFHLWPIMAAVVAVLVITCYRSLIR